MCANCVTGYEALALNSVALATAGSSLWERIAHPVPRATRRRQARDADARFLVALGIDADAVLGPAALDREPAAV
jgi:hypothetical protein